MLVGERDEVLEAARWTKGIEGVHGRIGARTYWSKPRRRSLACLKGTTRTVVRKNGWKLAEHAGGSIPDAVRHLFNSYIWVADLVRDDLRGCRVEHLGWENIVPVVEETGFRKKEANRCRPTGRTVGRRGG